MLNKVIKHKRNMDLCYRPIERVESGYKCWIFNQGFNKTYFIHEMCFISDEMLNNNEWLVCLEPFKDCVRYSKWVGLN